MKHSIFFVALMGATVAHAQHQVSGSFWYGSDTERSTEQITSFEGWTNLSNTVDVGAKVAYTVVEDSYGTNTKGTDFRLVGSWVLDNLTLNGGVGVWDAAGKTTTLGNLDVYWKGVANTVLSAGIDRSGVASIYNEGNAITFGQHVYRDRAYIAGDYSNLNWGAVGQLNHDRYSDNNSRVSVDAKVWIAVTDGFSVYVRRRYWHNSNPYTGNYFSPERLDRTLVGVQGRRRVAANTVVSGYVEGGRQEVDKESKSAYNWKLQLDHSVTDRFDVTVAVGEDTTLGGDYKYRYGAVYANVRF